jgi:hypothetical protein
MSELHRLSPDVSHPAPERARVPAWRLLTGLVLAPTVWAIQILASYGLTSLACFPRYAPLEGTKVPGMSVIVLIGSLLALALAAVALWAAITSWRRTRGEGGGGRDGAADVGEGRTRFLALCGLIISALFSAAIVWEAIVAIFLPHCFTAPA